MGALRRKLLDEELRAFETRSLEITTFDSAEVGRHTQQDSSHIVQIIIIIINLVCFQHLSFSRGIFPSHHFPHNLIA